MGQIAGPETLVFNLNQTPSNYPKEDNSTTLNQGESLKFNKRYSVFQAKGCAKVRHNVAGMFLSTMTFHVT
jgi:hypothetical protein